MRSAEESARSDRAHSDLEGMTEHSQHIKSIAKQAGADLVGIADLEGFHGNLPTVPDDLLAGIASRCPPRYDWTMPSYPLSRIILRSNTRSCTGR